MFVPNDLCGYESDAINIGTSPVDHKTLTDVVVSVMAGFHCVQEELHFCLYLEGCALKDNICGVNGSRVVHAT